MHYMSTVVHHLSSLVDLQLGHSFRQSLVDVPVGEVRVVATLPGEGEVVNAEAELPSISFEGSLSRLQLEAGDVLFRPRGVSTKAVYVESILGACIFAAPLVRMRVLDGVMLDSWYLQWALNSSQVQRDMSAQAKGSMILMVSMPSLRDIAIPVPPMEVQQRIVEIARLQREERALSAKLAEETQRYTEQALWAAAQKVR